MQAYLSPKQSFKALTHSLHIPKLLSGLRSHMNVVIVASSKLKIVSLAEDAWPWESRGVMVTVVFRASDIQKYPVPLKGGRNTVSWRLNLATSRPVKSCMVGTTHDSGARTSSSSSRDAAPVHPQSRHNMRAMLPHEFPALVFDFICTPHHQVSL